MKKVKSLNSQALWLTVGTGAALIAGSILHILTARSIGPSDYGVVATAISLGVAGVGFLDLGANTYWIRELASQRITERDLQARASSKIGIVLLVAAAVSAGAALIEPAFIAAGAILLSASIVQVVLIPLRAARQGATVGWLTVTGRVFSLITFIAMHFFGLWPGMALWTSLVAGDLVLVICTYAVTPPASRLRFRVSPFRNPWSGTRWFAIYSVSTSGYQLDLPILTALSGPTAGGVYGSVNKWIQPLLIPIGAFAAAAAPFFAAEQRVRALRGEIVKASWILIAALLLNLVVILNAPKLVNLLLGENFISAVPVLRLLALAMLLNIFTQPLLVALQSRHYDSLAAWVVLVGVVTQLIAVALLAPTVGALGAGIGVLLGQVVQFLATFGIVGVVFFRWRREVSPS